MEAAIRERVRETIEMVLQEEVEAALGAPRSQSGWRRPMAASASGRVSWCRGTGGAAGR